MIGRIAKAAFLVVLMSSFAHADNFSFTGNFTQDDNVQTFNFSVGAPSSVTLRTWSYAGGVNAAGQVIARGGFDPILALFTSTGALINQNDDGGCSLVAQDAVSGQCWDTFLTANLAAGNYTVSVMQYNNFAIGPNISNGFIRDGQGNFTGPLTGHPGGSFWDVANTQRDNHWAFDILNVQQATQTPAPEPSTPLLLLSGLAGVAAYIRKRNQ
jgi:hypothetical protein